MYPITYIPSLIEYSNSTLKDMPSRGLRSKTTGRRTVAASKKVIQASTSPDEEENETCDVCCSPTVSGKEDALLCEGSCQKWFHRYCAGSVRELFLFFIYKFYSICLLGMLPGTTSYRCQPTSGRNNCAPRGTTRTAQ